VLVGVGWLLVVGCWLVRFGGFVVGFVLVVFVEFTRQLLHSLAFPVPS
jgi:hypothetical protein